MIIPIIILHHNEYDFLDKCIDSIIIETDFPYEIYIIDNNSDSPYCKHYVRSATNANNNFHY